MMKLWENLKSPIQSWNVVIPNAVISDPSDVCNCTDVACIAVFKLPSVIWYAEYLTREKAAPESIRAL